ncbi:MAG: hypothetical protein ACFFD5_12330 [Candidatus Thorarchaeota archaeon]
MEARNVLKKLVHFAEHEYKDKRPKSVKIYRVKSKKILTRGMLPNLQLKEKGLVSFLILADYQDTLRIYSFSRQGTLLSGVNILPDPKTIQKMKKSIKLEFQYPRKKITN